MFGLTEIYTVLNVTPITTLLDSYGSGKALFSDSLIPEAFTGNKSINFYMIAPINGAIDLPTYEYSVNCRAELYQDSLTIAQAVFTALSRYDKDDLNINCSILQTLPPADSTDLYNTPVNLKLKMR